MSLPHISSLERGTRKGTARTWKRLAQALGATVADLKPPEPADPRQVDLFAPPDPPDPKGHPHVEPE